MDPIDTRPVSMSYFQLIARRFGDTEERRAAILAGTGVRESELGDGGAEIGLSQLLCQIDNMNSLFGEDWVVSAPELWRPSSHGALGVAASSAPTVRAALNVLVRYVRSRSSAHRLRLQRVDGAVVLEHAVAAPLTEGQRRALAVPHFITIRSFLQVLLGREPVEVGYRFAFAEPRHGTRIREILGGTVEFGAGASTITLPAWMLDERSPLADPALHQYACEHLDKALYAAGSPTGVRSRVERLLARSETGRLAAEAAAQTLGLSLRTLVRRLAEAGVTYRALLDEELKGRARRHLDAGVLSQAEIGERLGFADATGFSRACRRWFRAARAEPVA